MITGASGPSQPASSPGLFLLWGGLLLLPFPLQREESSHQRLRLGFAREYPEAWCSVPLRLSLSLSLSPAASAARATDTVAVFFQAALISFGFSSFEQRALAPILFSEFSTSLKLYTCSF